ncbi:MAG: UDP-N-acetylmuramoyl-L-alanyl-D-glutamate--2,6-diaminopimelate ligase [Caldimicrobium sp.]|nr:UDP-N-acetylmuramoyl-L-alanyl-D-glutamate--2,6-diaminopimelate ligase [Caldimicrobium sp.]MDW8093832.1 UDP-N-acetylmuramoyl-L-alanyl-D-glutamate--2,6-diaminopimelate ligase [Caldimicrobium sp.]
MKRLGILLEGQEVLNKLYLSDELLITGITDRAQEVKPGYLFVARRGLQHHGEEFIPLAVEKGAVAILRETPPDPAIKVSQLQVIDPLEVGNKLVLKFYDHPEKAFTFIGITGTNGKSSVSFFLKELLKKLGYPTGYVGTLFYEIGDREDAQETTPSIFRLGPLLKKAVEKNIKYMVMEVSSHALDQDRIKGIKFKVAGFTNLSRDHLDYHGNMLNYYLSKKKLFTHYLEDDGWAVVSLESEFGKRLADELLREGLLSRERLLIVNNFDIKAEILERNPGLKLELKIREKSYRVETQLVGDYQAKNLVTLLGCAVALNLNLEEVINNLKNLPNPPGRLELCGKKGDALIFVDYAHTPEALEQALKSLLPLKRGRIILLFGCGGNRDPGKRPLMGRVAQKLSDVIILTSDNPRYEDPLKIIEDIKEGLNGTKPYLCIPERGEAIATAVEMLQEGDILLVAGKGHERYQEIEGKKIYFSDQEEIKRVLNTLGETKC